MKTSVFIRGSQCTIVGLDKDTLTFLQDKFSYSPTGIEYTDAVKEGEWDGKVHVIYDRRFSLGLLNPVLDTLKAKNIDVEVNDRRQLGRKVDFPDQEIVLRPFQREIVLKAIEAKTSSIEVATGGGKSLIAADYIKTLGLKSLLIVPQQEIFKQMESTLTAYLGTPVGLIGSGILEPEFVTVATWQSLNNWSDPEYYKSLDVLVIDEAQHIGANVLRKIANHIPATYRLGMSGTLFREDNADLEIINATGPTVATKTYSELTKLGYLVPARFWLIRLPHANYQWYASYSDVYSDYVVNNQLRNEFIISSAKELLQQGRKVLIFVGQIQHGRMLAKMGGHKFVYATSPNRETIINELRRGTLQCLISTSLLQEGMDVPPIDALILASPSKSLIVTLQRIGRALRSWKDKKDAIVVDFIDDCKYLDEHFQRRIKKYKEEDMWSIERSIDSQKKVDDDWEN